jgi:competence protein ComEC
MRFELLCRVGNDQIKNDCEHYDLSFRSLIKNIRETGVHVLPRPNDTHAHQPITIRQRRALVCNPTNRSEDAKEPPRSTCASFTPRVRSTKPGVVQLGIKLARALDGWATAERGRFVLFLPGFMAVGVVAYFALPSEPPLWPAMLLVTLAFAVVALPGRRPYLRAGLLCLACLALGFAAARLASWRVAPWEAPPRGATVVSGRVAQVDLLPTGRRITVAAPSLDGAAPMARGVRVRLRDRDLMLLAAGDTVQVRALLRAPAPPAYPGGWDMQRDAYFGRMAAYGFAIGPAARLQAVPGSALQAFREKIVINVTSALPGARGAIAATLLTGIGTAIPGPDRAAFQASGLAHLLAVAGLHIGIVMALVFACCRRGLGAFEYTALRWPTRRIAAVAALAAGGAYLLLTGAHVPILRSFAMACLVTLAIFTERRAISLRALALAAAAITLAAPYEVMGVSFQMSFAAVLALVAGWEWTRLRLARLGEGLWWRKPALTIGGLAATSALAGTATLPFAAYHFGSTMMWYVPANIVAVPMTALWVMPWGIAALLLMPAGLHALALVPMGWGIAVLLWIAHGVAAWPDALIPVPQMPPYSLALAAFGLVWLCLWRTRLRLAGLPPLAISLLLACTHATPDLLVGADGRMAAAHVGAGVLAATQAGASSFEKNAPLRVWGQAARAFPPISASADSAVTCAAGQCRLRFGAVVAELAFAVAATCDGADIVISSQIQDGTCHATWIIDRRFVSREGATFITFPPGNPARTVVTTDRAWRGDRPWVLRPSLSLAAGLPMAQTE